MKKRAWIALGGNIGDRESYLRRALTMMEERGIVPVKVSSFYETKAFGKTDQEDFINAVCMAETEYEPEELLRELLKVESALGRVRTVRWGPRTIDLDVLFFEDEVIQTELLAVPHPELEKRKFVLEPLAEVSPEKRHPISGKSVRELLFDLELSEELEWLEARERFGIKLGLENTRILLERFGNPHQNVPCLHIAGTNGKGSLCTYLSCVLEEAGYKVGLFTSPFIETFRERFQINHRNISESTLLDLLQRMHPTVDELEAEGISPTYFEILTVMCFEYFRQEAVEIAVMEVGLGGLYDSTNVIEHPLASFIATIDYDHMDYLGETLPEIAAQKAGIIKPGSPVYCYPNRPEVIQVFRETATRTASPMEVLEGNEVEVSAVSLEGTRFSYREFKDLTLSMWGAHQAFNASLAILGLTDLRRQGVLDFSDENLCRGLERAKLIARLEILRRNPILLIDGSHNAEGIHALKEALSTVNYRRLILGIGILKDKNYREMISELIPLADEVVVTEIPMPRSLKAEELYEEVATIHSNAEWEREISVALKKTMDKAKKEDLILWCGSLYLVGEVRKAYFREYGEGLEC